MSDEDTKAIEAAGADVQRWQTALLNDGMTNIYNQTQERLAEIGANSAMIKANLAEAEGRLSGLLRKVREAAERDALA